MSKSTGLGKGLNAIFDIENLSNSPRKSFQSSGLSEIPLDQITPNPTQPRTVFDPEALNELSQSIRRLGVIQPITVKETGAGQYLIISGERRYRASKAAGLTTIPAYIRPAESEMVLEMSLVENIQREDLGAMEIAVTMQRLVEECNLTQEQLADRIGKKRSTVANYLRLLKLPAEVQFALREELITMGHARALISLEDPVDQVKILAHIIDASLSVRQVETLVKEQLNPTPKPIAEKKSRTTLPPNQVQLSERLQNLVGRPVTIKFNSKGHGKITINVNSQSDIDTILGRLK